MHRKKTFATAGAISATALAAVVALGANFGLFGLTSREGGPGQFKVVDATQVSPDPIARTEVVDIPVPVAAPSIRTTAPAPVASVPAPPQPAPPQPAATATPSGEPQHDHEQDD